MPARTGCRSTCCRSATVRSRRSRSWRRRSPIRPMPTTRAPASTRRISIASRNGARIRTIRIDYPIYGRSTYNRHRDGSGISFSSRHRPILTMRPGFLTFNDPRGSGMRHYPADLHLLAWLEAKGFAFDIVTDEDLDEEGVALIAPYRAVLTGSHPEYHTLGTLDALAAYTGHGGKMLYLGGNGFYWRVARDLASAVGDRTAPRRRWHPHLGGRTRRILSRSRRAVWAGCGGATGGRRRCWWASASPARRHSRARITAGCPPRAIRASPGCSTASRTT